MSKSQKNKNNILNGADEFAANQAGNILSSNVQQGTIATEAGMNLLLKKAEQIKNVDYEQAKGNLFEYIEAAKLNRNLANKGINRHYEVTDAKKAWGGLGEPHAPDDIRGYENGKIISRIQAKVNNDPNTTAGSDKGITNPKYIDMQRIVASDKYEDTLRALEEKYNRGEISKSAYIDAKTNIRSGLTDDSSGISSGGTTTSELKKAHSNPQGYARQTELVQYTKEIGATSVNMAATNIVVSGIINGTKNFFEVFQGKKELDAAIKETGVTLVKSGARGGATGGLSSILRIAGNKMKIPVISDSSAATAIAGGIIDNGVSLYAYTKGEISADELKESLQDTSVKVVSTIYFTKAIGVVFGAANPFIPIAVYTVLSQVVTCARSIIKNAELNAEEFNRITAIYEESTKLIVYYRTTIETQMTKYLQHRKEMFDTIIKAYEYDMISGENYDKAIYSIVEFSNLYGIELKHTNFTDFKTVMQSDDIFVL